MSDTIFRIIKEEFFEELESIRLLLKAYPAADGAARARVSAANAATLLSAAVFEEFVREAAREYARLVVLSTASYDKLPKKLGVTAWKRTMESLARIKFDSSQIDREGQVGHVYSRFSVVHEFVKGDLKQDIYRDLIHNENNMRPSELNQMFVVAGLSDICKKLCNHQSALSFFGETSPDKAHGRLLSSLNDFMQRRNDVAHALNSRSSSGIGQILTDLEMLKSIGESLCETLEAVSAENGFVQGARV